MLFTNECVTNQEYVKLIKFADNSIIQGFTISNDGDEDNVNDYDYKVEGNYHNIIK